MRDGRRLSICVSAATHARLEAFRESGETLEVALNRALGSPQGSAPPSHNSTSIRGKLDLLDRNIYAMIESQPGDGVWMIAQQRACTLLDEIKTAVLRWR